MYPILQDHLFLFASIVGILGLLMGSFFNVVIYRLPRILEQEWKSECQALLAQPISPTARYNLALPRSQCPHCSTPIAAYDNIPVLSFCWLRGRCRHCKSHISLRYPLIETFTGIISAYLALRYGFQPTLIPPLLLTWALIPLAMIDIDHMILPDNIVYPWLWVGLLGSALYLPGFIAPTTAIIGAVAGYVSLWSIYWGFKGLTGKEGLGYGDFKLLALFGAWVGWAALPFIVVLASTSGAIIGLYGVWRGKLTRETPMPFGPYLIVAGWLAYVFELHLTIPAMLMF